MTQTYIFFISLANLVLILAVVIMQFRRLFVGIGDSKKKSVIIDSCGLIDGRIINLARAGFIPQRIIVPSFILQELQYLADGTDPHKRERARFGLDIVKELGDVAGVNLEINQFKIKDSQKADERLIILARRLNSQIYTTDFNLLKVAELEGIKVLNVNELARELRPNVLPGEKLSVKIVQKGSGQGQGVGYTDDGVMVVVESASKIIGNTIEVVVDRMIGTLAGRMIFARIPKTKQKLDNRAKSRAKL